MKYVASAADEKPSSKGWIKMTTLLECYKILEQYPDSMTKDQFYRIAHTVETAQQGWRVSIPVPDKVRPNGL